MDDVYIYVECLDTQRSLLLHSVNHHQLKLRDLWDMDGLMTEKMHVQILLISYRMMQLISSSGFSIYNMEICRFKDVNWQTQTMSLEQKWSQQM